jgi:hypothetical protein
MKFILFSCLVLLGCDHTLRTADDVERACNVLCIARSESLLVSYDEYGGDVCVCINAAGNLTKFKDWVKVYEGCWSSSLS